MRTSNSGAKLTLLIIAIAVVAVVVFSIMVNAFKGNEAVQTSMPLDKAPAVAVFKGETLNDMARLLRPLDVQVPSAPTGITAISLRDAIYLGANNGNANLLTVWLTNKATDNSNLLRPDDAAKQLPDVAERLAKDSLPGATFVIMPINVSWKDWTLTVSRTGPVVVKGTSDSISKQLQNAIQKTSPTLAQANTTSVSVPVSFGLTKQTTMQPWFYNDQIIIKILPIPAGVPTASAPDISALGGKSGFIVGQEFLNNVFAFEYKDKLFGNQKIESLTEGKYHVQDLELSITEGKLTVTGYLSESPSEAPTKVSLDLTGEDIGATNFDFHILPPEPPRTSVDLFKKYHAWNFNMLFAKKLINLKLASSFQPLRPVEQQNLGNFFIGEKQLTGTSIIEKIQAKNGAVSVTGVYRFQGGPFQ